MNTVNDQSSAFATESTVTDKLNDTFKSGADVRSTTKRVPKYAGKVLTGLTILLLFFWFTFGIITTMKSKIPVPKIAPEVAIKSSIQSKVLTLETVGWSTPTRVFSRQCHISWVSQSGLPRHKTQGSSYSNPTKWFDIQGVVTKPVAWIRHQSRGPGATKIVEEIRPFGACS